jgi:hypothetical protein
MADAPKTLEMRVAELEDKLAKINITEDDLKAYHKVSALMGGGSAAAPAATAHGCILPSACRISGCWSECRGCIISSCITAACQPCAIFNQPFGSFGGGGG